MGDTYSPVEIRSTLRTFQEYLRDLIECKFDQFQTKLRLFVNFCERDDAFRIVTRHFHARGGDVREWFAESARSGSPGPLPQDPLASLAYRYKVLLEVKQQRIDLRNLLSTLFGGGSIQEAHARFRDEWLDGLRKSFERMIERIEVELAGKDHVDLEAAVDSALANLSAGAKPAAGKAPVEEAPAPPPAPSAAKKPAKAVPGGAKSRAKPALDERDFGEILHLLEKAVKEAKSLPAKAKADVQTDLKILKLVLSKHSPDPILLVMIAEPIERLGGKIGEIAAALALKAKREPSVR